MPKANLHCARVSVTLRFNELRSFVRCSSPPKLLGVNLVGSKMCNKSYSGSLFALMVERFMKL